MVTATRSSSLMIQQPPKKRFLGSRNVHSKLFSKEESVSKPTPPVVSPSPKKKSSSSRRLKVGENELNGNLDTFDDNGNNNSLKFQDLCVPPSELRPSTTLTTGQCFHWKVIDATTRTNAARNNESEDDDDDDDSPTTSRSKGEGKSSAWGIHNATEWVGVLRLPSGESLALVIRETESTTLYRVLKGPSNSDFNCSSFLKSYFQLDEPLEELYSEWSGNCNRLAQIASCIQGVRIVDQDPWECLVSFICSSNNNIPRITKMLAAIRREYGDPLVTFKEEDNEKEEVLYSFPSLKTLSAKATEDGLRKIGLGYRAKYLMETMETLESLGGEPYLQELRSISEPILVQEKLIQFKGVGRKVADCIALFSLKQDRAIPVDVHVWNIAQRDYDPTLENVKSLTPTGTLAIRPRAQSLLLLLLCL